MNTVQIDPRNHLLAFVHLKHYGQKRKYTGEDYVNHLKAVAKMVDGKCELGYEVGLCHDLLEDTDCTEEELKNALMRFEYGSKDSIFIFEKVRDLTDRYVPETCPTWNRTVRKKLEAERLWTISPEAQTVKYCDIINNSESILQYDAGFAKIYIPEMQEVLKGMNKGHKGLYKKALKSVNLINTI